MALNVANALARVTRGLVNDQGAVGIPAWRPPHLAVLDDGDGSVTVQPSGNTFADETDQVCRLYYWVDGADDWTLHTTLAVGDAELTDLGGLAYLVLHRFMLIPYEVVSGVMGKPSNVFDLRLRDVSAGSSSAEDLIREKGGGAYLSVEPRVESRDGIQSHRYDWTPSSTTMPCWAQPTSSAIREAYQQKQLVVTHKVFVARDPGAKTGYRLRVCKDGEDDRLFLVRGVTDHAGLGEIWRIDVEEVLA